MTEWSAKMLTRLRVLHADAKIGFTEIAETLSHEFRVKLTKNACIGKARRIGLPMRIAGNITAVSHARKLARNSVAKTVPPVAVAATPPQDISLAQPYRAPWAAWTVEVPTLPPTVSRVTIYQLRRGICHFPLGDNAPYSYCGNTAHRKTPYCPYHHRVMYGARRS